MSIQITKPGTKPCRPFSLDVMVMSPEANYQFRLAVGMTCSAQAEPLWKLVFDLNKNMNGTFVPVLHVAFQAESPVEAAGLQSTAFNGVNPAQADLIVNQIHPIAKRVAGSIQPAPADTQAIQDRLSAVARLGTV